MDRRTWLRLAGWATAAAVFPKVLRAEDQAAPSPPPAQTPGFSQEWLDAFAKSLASRPYEAPKQRLDSALKDISYDQYRDIRYKPEKAIWREDNLPFRLELFHTGGAFYAFPVSIFIVESGRAALIPYSPDLFTFGPLVKPPAPGSNSGFAGFKVRTTLNKPNVFDEFLVFLGASYFRAIAAEQVYGLSARGLAINTGQSGGEEFPLFRSFWIERPMPGNQKLTIWALLDSISATGRYKFVVTPGRDTVMDVDAVVFPRAAIGYAGVAPLTSMFFFGANEPATRKDFRPAVHDSEGLSMWSGAGEWIWRPLINPARLQFSVFLDRNPKGFGLLQNTRSFAEYQDLEALYGRRPSAWVEPLSEWGDGSIDLIELPANEEFHDNIVCFWRPKDGFPAKAEQHLRYRLHWCWTPPVKSNKATVTQTRVGETRNSHKFFVIDFANTDGCEGCAGDPLKVSLSASAGEIKNPILAPNTIMGGHRLTFEYLPAGTNAADLRAVLTARDQPASETWIYRWTP
jgi:glucans biosynthesis protein